MLDRILTIKQNTFVGGGDKEVVYLELLFCIHVTYGLSAITASKQSKPNIRVDAEGIFTTRSGVKPLKKHQIYIGAVSISSDLRLLLMKTPQIPPETLRTVHTQ